MPLSFSVKTAQVFHAAEAAFKNLGCSPEAFDALGGMFGLLGADRAHELFDAPSLPVPMCLSTFSILPRLNV